ncbi:MAG TPA: glycine cleavage system protein T, partial [Thermomicrobiales bacterium]|nr:glycine cleavage system protein T [Thermomicrobiales bacterium]
MTSNAAEPLRDTPLKERHVALGARLIPFAGWVMPVQYGGIVQEHHAVRNAAGLFDLNHMGQAAVEGPDALPFLQAVTTNDVSVLEPGAAQYSLLPNERGGLIDDIIVYRRPSGDGYFVVLNASNRERDVAWMQVQAAKRLDLDVRVEDVSDRTGMIAIQGPRAEAIVQPLTPLDLSALPGFHMAESEVSGIPTLLA